MLTRLIVSGFKNLVDVDVRFGPFTTCVAGANGVGKSNLFDAIRFLSRSRIVHSWMQLCLFGMKERTVMCKALSRWR